MTFMKTLALLLSLLALPLLAADQPKPRPNEKAAAPKGVRNVGVEEFDKLRREKNTVVLDVRTETEFKDGHIPGAVNLDYTDKDFRKKVAELDKSKTYLVHCAGGNRSGRACDIMSKGEFTNVVNLAPGFNAWEKAGKPMAKK
jgi:phage shock protein E